MTSSLLELLVAAKNKMTSKQANKVTSSLLELLVAAKNIIQGKTNKCKIENKSVP